MPDWIVQTPVSTVRPTPPKAPAAGGGSGTTDYIRMSSEDGYAIGTPTNWTTDYQSGSCSRSGGTITLSRSGIWHVSASFWGAAQSITGGIAGAAEFIVGGSVYVPFAVGCQGSEIDEVMAVGGSGALDVEVVGTTTVSFNRGNAYKVLDTETLSSCLGFYRVAAHWVGP